MSVFLVAKGDPWCELFKSLHTYACLRTFGFDFFATRKIPEISTYLLLENLIKGATYAPIQVFQALRAGVNKSWTSEK